MRAAFLDYFEARGHRVVSSSPLVPQNDPTLLFANAGMNQFKDVFLGKEKRDYVRAASSQKCVRAGGKHNDLENVGYTARHHTFFEMLGNFSFGDYFKKRGDRLRLGVPDEGPRPARRTAWSRPSSAAMRPCRATPRPHGFWTTHVPADRILELGAKDNFWAMGDAGPCGPCSEIHFNQGDSLPCAEVEAGRPCLGVECECDRWLEVWNLVFMQYDRGADGHAHSPARALRRHGHGPGARRCRGPGQALELRHRSVHAHPRSDRGARRARTTALRRTNDVSLRVIADHLRATTFLVADGVLPGNEGRGYVLRKIMRRAMRHGKKLGLEGTFLHELSAAVVERMRGPFPELLNQAAAIERVIRLEEERFASTLKQALGGVRAVRCEGAAGRRPSRRRRLQALRHLRPCRSTSPRSWRRSAASRWTTPASSGSSRRSRSARGNRAAWAR